MLPIFPLGRPIAPFLLRSQLQDLLQATVRLSSPLRAGHEHKPQPSCAFLLGRGVWPSKYPSGGELLMNVAPNYPSSLLGPITVAFGSK